MCLIERRRSEVGTMLAVHHERSSGKEQPKVRRVLRGTVVRTHGVQTAPSETCTGGRPSDSGHLCLAHQAGKNFASGRVVPEDPFHSLPAIAVAALLALALVVALFIANKLGTRAVTRRRQRVDLSPLVTMASGLLGLLLAFNFSIAQSRFDARQQILVREADAIGTAYLRCSVLADEERKVCQERFRRYVALRISTYAAYGRAGGEDVVSRSLSEAERLQDGLWQVVSQAVRASPDPARVSLMSALNAVIDMDSDRRASLRIQVPGVVSVVIILSCLAWAVLIGYSVGLKRYEVRLPWVVVALLISLVFGVALDFDRPRSGFITTSAADRAMEDLLRSMTTT